METTWFEERTAYPAIFLEVEQNGDEDRAGKLSYIHPEQLTPEDHAAYVAWIESEERYLPLAIREALAACLPDATPQTISAVAPRAGYGVCTLAGEDEVAPPCWEVFESEEEAQEFAKGQ